MKTMKLQIVSLLFFVNVFLSVSESFGQNDFMDTPANWSRLFYKHPERYYDLEGNDFTQYWTVKSMKPEGSKKSRERWIVFPDREGVAVYREPNTNSRVEGKLEFAGDYYLVLDEEGEFLQLTDLSKQPIGWCHKKYLLLWDEALRDKKTGIEIKAFMINKLEQGRRDSQMELIRSYKEQYVIYDGPGSEAKEVDKKLIYDVFFVFKYEHPEKAGQSGRFLVGPYSALSDLQSVLGWVNEDRLQLWTTSLCLEPNYDIEAIKERKEKNVIATVFPDDFGGQDAAKDYLQTGNSEEGLVKASLREYDESGNINSELSRRMYPKAFRYPVIGGEMINESNCKFQTGVSGVNTLASSSNEVVGFDDDRYLKYRKKRDKFAELLPYHNIIFVIDGTAGMDYYMKFVADLIRGKSANEDQSLYRYGAVIYRNEFSNRSWEQNPIEEILTVHKPTFEADVLAGKIESIYGRCGEFGDNSKNEAVYFALKKAIELCAPEETNIIVHLGNSPDNSTEGPLFDGKTNTTSAEVAFELRDETEIHYLNYVVDVSNPYPDKRADMFKEISGDLMPQLARVQESKYGDVDWYEDFEKPKASVVRKEENRLSNLARMNESAFVYKSYLMKTDNTKQLYDLISADLDTCSFYSQQILEHIKMIVDDTSPIGERAETFSVPILDFVSRKLAKEGNQEELEEWDEFRNYCVREKVHLYMVSSTYYKTQNISNPLFKYVLFMRDDDLDVHMSQIENLLEKLRLGDEAEQREALDQYWRGLALSVLALSEKNSKKQLEKLSLNEIQDRLFGIYDLNIIRPQIDDIGGLRIEDFQDKSKLPDSKLQPLREKIKKTLQLLEELKESDYYYEAQESEERYYWVPVEYLYG